MDNQNTHVDMSLGGKHTLFAGNVLARKLAIKFNVNTRTDFPVTIVFPERKCILTAGFFLEMFTTAIQDAGSATVFKERFHFKCNTATSHAIKSGIKEALRTETTKY